MTNEAEVTKQFSPEMERMAAKRARERAKNARWDLNVAVFLFAVLILVIILSTYTEMGIEVVAPIAIFGLVMVWLMGWRRGRQLYQEFYEEEIARVEQDLERQEKKEEEKKEEETIEEKVQKALRERWR